MSRITNFEKYKDEILSITDFGDNIAFVDGKVCIRNHMIDCSDCSFGELNGMDTCYKNIVEWLCSYTKPTLTRRERAFCEYAQIGHITRDQNGQLFHAVELPIKEELAWSGGVRCEHIEYVDFNFITWDDEEPWSVEDLLKLEVEK